VTSATDRPGRPRRMPFAAVVVGLLGLGLIGQLVLNTSLQHGSFSQYDLAIERSTLAEQRQDLEQQLADRQEPGALAARAAELGMVHSENPVFLRLADGGVSGTPVEATAPPPPPTTPPPTTPPPTTPPPTTPPPTTPAIPPSAPATAPAQSVPGAAG
jgi:hypothetical protein